MRASNSPWLTVGPNRLLATVVAVLALAILSQPIVRTAPATSG